VADAELRSGSRRRSDSKARKRFCQGAVTQSGVTGAAAARFLGLTTSAVSRSVAGGESQQWDGQD
jgi:hypothetical protein